MIRGTDGLDYRDLAARIRCEPASTTRNNSLLLIRSRSHAEECEAMYHTTYAWAMACAVVHHEAGEAERAAEMLADMKVSELRGRIAQRLDLEKLSTYLLGKHDDRLDALRSMPLWAAP